MSADTTMGGPYRDWAKLEPMSNRRLQQRPSRQARIGEYGPQPAHLPGQLSLLPPSPEPRRGA